MTKWLHKNCVFRGPTAAQTSLNGRSVDARNARPLDCVVDLALAFNPVVSSGVIGLFRGCGPETILGRISFVVIYALKGMFRTRARPHVFEECLKRSSPLLADSNTTTTPIFIADMSTIVAAAFHSLPSNVFGGTSQSMFRLGAGHGFPPQATTTFGAARSQQIHGNDGYSATITKASPVRARFGGRGAKGYGGLGYNFQTAKTTISKVFKFRHKATVMPCRLFVKGASNS